MKKTIVVVIFNLALFVLSGVGAYGSDPAVISPRYEYAAANGPYPPQMRAAMFFVGGVADSGNLWLYSINNYLTGAPDVLPSGWCNGPKAQIVAYSVADTPAAIQSGQPYTRNSVVSPCFGDETQTYMEYGLGAVARAGNGQLYIAVNRSEGGADWNNGHNDGDFVHIYLGANTSPGFYAYRLSPILTKSSINNVVYEFLPPSLIASASDPNVLWGFIPFGTPDSGPTKIGRIKIVVDPTEIRPRHALVYLMSGGGWQPVPSGGVISFVPDDFSSSFPAGAIGQLVFNSFTHQYEQWGHLGITQTSGMSGCEATDITKAAALFYNVVTEGGSISSATQVLPAINEDGGRWWPFVHDAGGHRYAFYGSTDRTCETNHNFWLNNAAFGYWAGVEILVHQLQ